MKFEGKNGELFQLETIHSQNINQLNQSTQTSKDGELILIWFETDDNQVEIDSITYTFNKDEFVCLTEFHRIKWVTINQLRWIRWNRPFYCILNHDSEVSCKGILYYGATKLPIIQPDENDRDVMTLVWKVLENEMKSFDNLQQEMLQMLLKRILILCTRVYKKQVNFDELDVIHFDIVREYNFLVETYFRTKHTVCEYADLLHKSPKTLSNLFKKIGEKSPLQFIHDRKLLEAKRLLFYTDKSISEIGYELGFADLQTFSRFFKSQLGVSPNEFKSNRI